MTAKKIMLRVILLVTTVTLSLFLSAFPAAAAVNPESNYYRVQPGDSLWLIGLKYHTTPGALMAINNLTSTEIYPGQQLRITGAADSPGDVPEAVRYTVQPGDSLYLIGLKFGTNAAAIIQANGLESTEIYPGQLLAIPGQLQRQHIVKAGDTLYLIAKRYGTSIDALVRVNSLKTTELWPGQALLLPGSETGTTQPDTDNGGGSDGGTAPVPVGGQWGPVPEGVSLYHVRSGETLWELAQRYKTTQAAIMTTNHLHTDLLQVNQPLFIPANSQSPVNIPYPEAVQKAGYGMLYDWEYVSWILDTKNTAVLKDLVTGKSFKARRLGGSNHADMEPLTAADTRIMKEIFGGSWNWNRRAVLVYVDGKVIAGSMAGMPHDIQTISDNDFPGHFDLHFLNSRKHSTNSIDPEHQAMVQKAAGN
ncbi:LysM peptidoglycan-binding domain-containing protein [Phosphitispora fastidiosa]|uniref:LysM peptidoglycan-binding domain-containing protein n=1 Tax=Phosphitispora fastidiosa TaxID=2837202 RepID=UPI001E3B4B53|nr:LysM peptidoglycan-binding domain-containing protein [Phosphitispora fastidiosa]MBU7006691.1 LysM repeat protein [Phosphitispora fastidiosa]